MDQSHSSPSDAPLPVSDKQAIRRGLRVKRPTSRAIDATEAPEADSDAHPTKPAQTARKRARTRRSGSPPGIGEGSSANHQGAGSEEDAAGSEGEAYCICRGPDDGKPMVWCASCDDWFHFRCVGLTKKKAETLAEYVCGQCEARTGKKSRTLDEDAEQDDSEQAQVQEKDAAPSPSPTSQHEEKKASRRAGKGSGAAPSASIASALPSMSRPEDFLSSPSSHKRTVLPKELPTSASRLPSKDDQPIESIQKSPLRDETGGRTALDQAIASQTAAVRKHAVAQFALTLQSIFASGSRSKNAAEKSLKYATELEEALFQAYAEKSGTRAAFAGKGFKDKLRTFIFSLKDKQNGGLRERISGGRLSATSLAKFSNAELANEQIRLEVERRRKENLEQSILKKDAAPIRKITHKGEVDIEYEPSTRGGIDDTRPDSSAAADGRAKAPSRKASPSRPRQINLAASDKRKPLEQPAKKQSSATGPGEAISPMAPGGGEQSPSLSFDFAAVWKRDTGETTASQEEPEDEGVAEPVDVGENEAEKEGSSSPAKQEDPHGSRPLEGPTEDDGADVFIDGILDIPAEPKYEPSPPPEEDVAQAQQRPVVWCGAISMPEAGVFSGQARQVLGREIDEFADLWAHLFPSQHSPIEGRLPSQVAEGYLMQVLKAPRNELVVLEMTPSFESAALSVAASQIHTVPSSEEGNTVGFDHMLAYFHRRQRYGVLAPASAARGNVIKDFYIMALPANADLPAWVEQLDHARVLRDGTRGRDRFLLVAVLFKIAVKDVQTTPADREIDAPPAQDPHLESLLSRGPSALQDLLQAVGGNSASSRSEASSPMTPTADPASVPASGTSPTPPNSLQMQTSAVPTAAATSQGVAPSTAVALSRLPHHQLETVLISNPNLVEELLNTLRQADPSSSQASNSDAATNNASPTPPPPGPPPPRPPQASWSGFPAPGPPPVRPPTPSSMPMQSQWSVPTPLPPAQDNRGPAFAGPPMIARPYNHPPTGPLHPSTTWPHSGPSSRPAPTYFGRGRQPDGRGRPSHLRGRGRGRGW